MIEFSLFSLSLSCNYIRKINGPDLNRILIYSIIRMPIGTPFLADRYSLGGLLIVACLLSSVSGETINIASMPGFSNDLFSNMKSTFNLANKQTANLGNLFSMDDFFGPSLSTAPTTNGNNILQGSGNLMQGYNNKLNG